MPNLDPEQIARPAIDTQLTAAGWAVQDMTATNFHAGKGQSISQSAAMIRVRPPNRRLARRASRSASLSPQAAFRARLLGLPALAPADLRATARRGHHHTRRLSQDHQARPRRPRNFGEQAELEFLASTPFGDHRQLTSPRSRQRPTLPSHGRYTPHHFPLTTDAGERTALLI